MEYLEVGILSPQLVTMVSGAGIRSGEGIPYNGLAYNTLWDLGDTDSRKDCAWLMCYVLRPELVHVRLVSVNEGTTAFCVALAEHQQRAGLLASFEILTEKSENQTWNAYFGKGAKSAGVWKSFLVESDTLVNRWEVTANYDLSRLEQCPAVGTISIAEVRREVFTKEITAALATLRAQDRFGPGRGCGAQGADGLRDLAQNSGTVQQSLGRAPNQGQGAIRAYNGGISACKKAVSYTHLTLPTKRIV